MNDRSQSRSHLRALDKLKIELPSWGFANTGTRFGKFLQLDGSNDDRGKFSDAAQVQAITGAAPTLALHVQWDLPGGVKDVAKLRDCRRNSESVRDQSIPIFFKIKNTSMVLWRIRIRRFESRLIQHILACVTIAEALGSRDVSPWFADGSNFPGTQSIRHRIGFLKRR